MEEIEIPQYFICPISLQLMKDPVTAVTGITYDRESIEQWLMSAKLDTMISCPVTKQPLQRDNWDLTPNHTLRRLIQAWCIANATKGVDRIPTPKSSLDKTHVVKLVRELGVSRLCLSALKKMEELAMENERNKSCMAEAGVAKEMCLLIMRFLREGRKAGLEEALRILRLIWSPKPELKNLVNENYDFIDSLIWVLHCEIDNHVVVKAEAMLVLKMAIGVANSSRLERLKLDFFKTIIMVLRGKICHSQQAIKSALHVLIEACPWGRNRLKIVEAGAIFELIELELENPEKNITELIFNVLSQLCSSADGRAEFLRHAGSMALVSKRILRVSSATDDRAIHILSLIAKFSATNEVIQEMLRVGAVTKLCMVMQADCAMYLKEKARGVLKLHSIVWNNSPCIAVYLLTRHQR
ncbi:E3 ubiquitin-protein ligase PUB24-like [Fagus crenata]